MADIDPRFKAAKERAATRQKKRAPWGIILSVVIGLVGIGGGAWYFLGSGMGIDTGPTDVEVAEDDDAYASPFIDLAGDPMVLELESGGGAMTSLPPPPELAGTRITGDVILISDVMIARDNALVATVPTRREDFAFFQSQRSIPTDEESKITGDSSTSLRLTPERARPAGTVEVIVRLRQPADNLAAALADSGISSNALSAFDTTLRHQGLAAGSTVAARYVPDGLDRVPLQVSIYSNEEYLASAASDDLGQTVTPSADPWVDDNLLARISSVSTGTSSRKFRMIDAIYSTGMRNGMPASLLGEAIVLLSKAFDTDAFAQPGDRLTVAYSTGSELGAAAQILYVAVERSGGPLKCYVAKGNGDHEFRCWGPDISGRASGPRLRKGVSDPVSGVMRTGFGPQRDAVSGKVKHHPGIDWAAPMGSPVRAAITGNVLAIDEDPEFGKTIVLQHQAKTTTFYAHLSSVENITVGTKVSAGTTIGRVGISGNTNVPHLHFEYRQEGKAVDPFIHDTGGLAGEAVGALVDQIIKVESGGRACVKAATSSATGLGQFIESTWIRMMKTYRADLYSSLSRPELLALRCDPTLSYEMITNLAREGESYLSSRGHEVTAGRLYMAHFLGAGSASKVLSAPDDAPLAEVVGTRVVNANKFLKGKDVAYIKAWADRKMRGRGGKPSKPPTPSEVVAFQQTIDAMLADG